MRDFLAANAESFPTKSYDTAEGFEQHRRWDKVLFDAGLSVITWPKKYGGRDAPLLQWVVYEEEYFRAGAPGRASANGTSMLAPTLFAHGTEEQLDRILPKMASGEEIWAQAWSEPESGSDLASLRSTATKTDGGWMLNGQKIWSSRAPFGERGFGLFRSDPEAAAPPRADLLHVRPEGRRHHGAAHRPARRRHRLRRDLPRRRVRARRGRDRRAERRLARRDEHVEQRARHVAAQPGPLPGGRRTAGRSCGRDSGTRPRVFADRVADAWIKAQAYRLQTFGTVTRLAAGGELGAESSVTKVFWSDLDVAMHQTALDLRGADGELADAVDRRPTCSRSAARSTPAPTRFSATSSPSGCWACPGKEGKMKFELDEQQRDFAASIDAALGAADLPAAVRAWAARRHRAGPQGVGQLADLGVTALAVPEKFDGIDAHPVDLVVALERWAAGACPAR